MAIWILQPDSDGNCCDCTEREEPCDLCTPNTGCACALYLPPINSEYSSLLAAQSGIANVNNCIGYISTNEEILNSFTAVYSSNQVSLVADTSVGSDIWLGLSVGTGPISISYTTEDSPITPCSGTTCTSDTIPTSVSYQMQPFPAPSYPLGPQITIGGVPYNVSLSGYVSISAAPGPLNSFGGVVSVDASSVVFTLYDWAPGNPLHGTVGGNGKMQGSSGCCEAYFISTATSDPPNGHHALLRPDGMDAINTYFQTNAVAGTNEFYWIPCIFGCDPETPNGGFDYRLYDCDGGYVQSASSPYGQERAGTLITDSVPQGTYILNLFGQGADSSSAITALVSSSSLLANPAIALWDDAGTTRQLEACSKMLLPFGTEASDDWFVDLTEATTWMESFVFDCLVQCTLAGVGSPDFCSASFSSNTLSIVANGTASDPLLGIVCSVNLEVGKYLVVNYSITSSDTGNGLFLATVYDYNMTSLDNDSSGNSPLPLSGTLTLDFGGSGAPYTGRYVVLLRPEGLGVSAISTSLDVTSSGTMTSNEAQALYDVGLDCPARLSCT